LIFHGCVSLDLVKCYVAERSLKDTDFFDKSQEAADGKVGSWQLVTTLGVFENEYPKGGMVNSIVLFTSPGFLTACISSCKED
jgi:hypothetical protein